MNPRNSKFRQGFVWKVREVESFGFKKCSHNFHVVAHASKGKDSSYFGLFSILGVVWLNFNALRGCLALFALRGRLAK